MRAVSYTCEICGVAKSDANHWYIAAETNVGINFHSWGWAVREEQVDEDGTKHLCGQECCHKLLDQFFMNHVQPLDLEKYYEENS